MSADSGSDSDSGSEISSWSSNRDGYRHLRICEKCDDRKDAPDAFCLECEWCSTCNQYKDWADNTCGDCSRCGKCNESQQSLSACCVCDVYYCDDTCLTWPDADKKPRLEGPVCASCAQDDDALRHYFSSVDA